MRIEILDAATDAVKIAALTGGGAGYRVVDGWPLAQAELGALDPTAQYGESDVRYVVYPWRRTVVRLPEPTLFYRLRTARNRFLIDDVEQRAWSDATIGVAGLSVGASALSVCSLTGARRFRLAEYDTLGFTNLNRLAGSVCDIGTPKLTMAYRRVLELDPYSSIESFSEGYSEKVAPALLGTSPGDRRLTVLLEEMDDIAAKVDVRRRARAAGIPVMMVTDNGDNVILDVERFDLDPSYPLFHGRAGDLTGLDATDLRDPRERARLAQRIVGAGITPRTRFSLTQVGRTLTGWPQLGTAATLAGAVAAYAARLLATGEPVPSGRYRVDLDRALLGPETSAARRWNEMDENEFRAAMSAHVQSVEDD